MLCAVEWISGFAFLAMRSSGISSQQFCQAEEFVSRFNALNERFGGECQLCSTLLRRPSDSHSELLECSHESMMLPFSVRACLYVYVNLNVSVSVDEYVQRLM
jgi:hypothetical protein